MYYNYHATAKRLIRENKLVEYYFKEKHGDISPALILHFNDKAHPIMPIRHHRWEEYLEILPPDKMSESRR